MPAHKHVTPIIIVTAVICGITGFCTRAGAAEGEYFEKCLLRLTARDNDGHASVETYVSKWDEQRRKWTTVIRERRTREGKCEYSLEPGRYQLHMYYQEADPRESRVIDGIQITDKAVVDKDAYFEKGMLRLTTTDHDGWASVETYVARWDDDKRKWDTVIRERSTRDGRADYSLAPGVYQLTMYYQEASPRTRKVVHGIQISDGVVIEKQAYFDRGLLRLTATDQDGWASVETYVSRWNDETRKWDSVIRERSTRDGRADYPLAPGVYQLVMYYQEAYPREQRVIENLEVADKVVIEKQEYFEKGMLRLTATDNDGWARLETYVSLWNGEKGEWQSVIREKGTRDGRVDYYLSPGVYKLDMYYQEARPTTKRTSEGIVIADRETVSLGERFDGGNLPPIISASGPFEIGDGDGFYELGERVLFRVHVTDSDMDSVEFLINDRVLRSTTDSGKYEQVLCLNVPGEYRFAVRARDKNGTLETFGRTIPVSMQKEHPRHRARHLPETYGRKQRVMVCPKCGKTYHHEAAKCPEDGTQLNAAEKVVHAVLDASLVRAGIDPTTPEAKRAKKLGIDWLNPFTSQEEIDKGIKRLVDDVMGE